MKWGNLLWGVALVAGGSAVLAGGTAGPRIGVGLFLIMMGVLIVGIPLSTWFVGRFARPETGRCPVGEPCSGCQAFNLKPRQECRACGLPVNRSVS